MKRIGKVSKKAIAAFMIVGALSLAGCSGDGGKKDEPASGGEAAGSSDISGEITYGYWDDDQTPALKKNIEDFNKLYPDVKVTLNQTPYGQYWTKMQTQAESGTLPDVFWINGPNFELYASYGMVEPVTELIDSGKIDPSNYPDSLNNLYSIDGVQYAVPKDYDTIGLWYNKAIFEEAGVDLPTDDWTWDDFTTAANDISSALADKNIYGVAFMVGGQESYYNTIYQAGGEVISADKKTSGFGSPEAIEGLQFWADLVESGASPTIQQLSDTSAPDRFASGKAAMIWDGNWALAKYMESDHKDDIDVIGLPKGKERASIIHGLGYAVSKNSQNMEAAQAFQAFLGSEEAAKAQGELGGVIPAFQGTQQTFLDFAPDLHLDIFIQAADDYSVPYPTSLNGQAWGDLETVLLPPAFAGDVPMAEAAKDLATQMDAILAAN